MASDELVEPFGAAIAPMELDPQQIAINLHEAVRQRALEAFNPRQPEFESLELETTLWSLVSRLAGTDSKDLPALVIDWVQANLSRPSEPGDLQSIKWLYTRGEIGKRNNNSGTTFVTELDLDAPLRQARPISPEDAARDESLFKYVFNLLLVGEYKLARMACSDTNNWLLLASLDALLDTETTGVRSGTSSSQLVRSACRTLALAPQISKYEAGIYGLLSGELSVVAPLCESWDALLLCHIWTGASLEAFERSVSQDHKIALQASDWRRQIALALIQGRFPNLVAELLREVSDPATTATSAIVSHPWLIRVLLHIQLSLGQPVDPKLVQIYIEYLVEDPELLSTRLDLVPTYARLLPSSSQPEIYGQILAQITDSDTQNRQLELANHYKIELAPCIEYAVRLNFELYSTDLQQGVEPSEERLVGVLHWPVAAGLWPTAAHSLCKAYSFLLSQDQRSAVILLTQNIGADYVRNRTMDAVRAQMHDNAQLVSELAELQQFALLGNALAALSSWSALSSGSGTTGSTVPGWRSTAPKVVGTVIDAVNRALQFAPPASSLLARSDEQDLEKLRTRYIPLLVYELFDVLMEARTSVSEGYTKVALEFAVKIADEKHKLYELFDEKLMKVLAEIALTVKS